MLKSIIKKKDPLVIKVIDRFAISYFCAPIEGFQMSDFLGIMFFT